MGRSFLIVVIGLLTCLPSVFTVVAAVDCTANPDDSACACYFQNGEWGTCSNLCGNGVQTRTAKCMCGGIEQSDQSLCGTPITTQNCTGDNWYWSTSGWSECAASDNSGCNSGTQTREVYCRCAGHRAAAWWCDEYKKPSDSRDCQDYSKCTCAWKYGDWTSCWSAAGCGTGSQTRTASCLDADGHACNAAACGNPDVTVRTCQDQTSCACDWRYSDFGVCSSQCGKGTKDRTAKCFCGPFYQSDQSKCIDAVGPADLQDSCEDYSGCSCCWVPGDYGTCSADCGPGTQTRPIKCQCGGVDVEDETHCSSLTPKPDDTKDCDGSSCSCEWEYTPWSTPCSNNCGDGTQTRTGTCKCNGHAASDDSLCGPKEPESQPCNDRSGCTCAWEYTPFSTTCSNTCGTGVYTRGATCKCNGQVEPNVAYCGARNPLTMPCTDKSGCTCAWEYSPFCDCSNKCGDGTQTRDATCKCGPFVETDVTKCGNKLPTSQTCTDTSQCVCKWVYSPFQPCSNTCGAGTQSRTASCSCNGVTKPDSYCTGINKEPLSQTCTGTGGCTCAWEYSPFCTCSNTCGDGTQTRTATCKCGGVVQTDVTKCGSKAPLSQTCTETSGCVCKWVYTPFQPCSNTCGAGTQSRTASCSCNGQTKPDSYCTGITKDPLSQTCTGTSGCTCAWEYTPFCSCSNTCGTGTQTREATCKCGGVVQTDVTKCGAKAPLSQTCTGTSGCTCAWEYSPFCECSTKCGDGTRTRTATCKCGGMVQTDISKCGQKAPLSETCSDTSGCTCKWVTGPFCGCSAANGCGTGTQTRDVGCYCGTTHKADSYCQNQGAKPPSSQSCQDSSKCCAFTYGDYGTCSNTCGTGVQTRTATCKCGGVVKPNSYCGTADTTKSCTSNTGCQCTWKYSDFTPCSNTCGSGTQTRTTTECSDCTKYPKVICDPSKCGTPVTLTKSCTGMGTCGTGCVATDCNDGANDKASVSFKQGPDGTLIGTVTFTQPAYGDLRGIFINFPYGSSIDPSKCTITGSAITAFQRSTNELSSQTSVNLNGCKNPYGGYDLAAAIGTEGQSKDDIHSTTFTLTCTGKSLTPSTLNGALVGVRATSIGSSSRSRENSAKMSCFIGTQSSNGRRL